MDISHFIYPFINWWTFKFFLLWVIMNKAAMNFHVEVFVWMHVFSCLGCITRRGISGSHGNCMFNFLRNYQNFPKKLYHFALLQQCIRVPISLDPYQHLLLSVFFILASLVHVKWYFIVVLIFISLTTNDVQSFFMCCWPPICLLWRNFYSNQIYSSVKSLIF